jgi:hypothetical protein
MACFGSSEVRVEESAGILLLGNGHESSLSGVYG